MKRLIFVSTATCLSALLIMLLCARSSLAVNPAQWTIVEEVNRGETTKTWTSPTAINLGKMVWQYDVEISKITATVNLGIFGNVTQDITDLIPPEDRTSAGETRDLPAVLLDDMIADTTTGTTADVFVEIDSLGFGQALFSNIMLGSVEVPLFGSRPIQRINVEANVNVIGYDFGDYNRDGEVDAADYTVWQDALGQAGTGLAADGDGDGTIDPGDYTIWKSNFGSSAGGGADADSLSVVPEPATYFLILAGALMLSFRSAARLADH